MPERKWEFKDFHSSLPVYIVVMKLLISIYTGQKTRNLISASGSTDYKFDFIKSTTAFPSMPLALTSWMYASMTGAISSAHFADSLFVS